MVGFGCGIGRGSAVVAALLLVSVGCGLELAEGGDGQDTDTTAGGGSSGDPEADEDTASPTGATTGDTGAGLTGSATDGGDSTGSGSPSDTSGDEVDCELDCGANGWCEDVDGGPTCACDEGFVSTGLDCLQCTEVTNGDLPADIPAINGRFSFLLGGEAPPSTPFRAGTLALRNRTTLDVVELGRTSDENVAMLVVPGTYDVIYSHREGAEGIPRNAGAKITTLEVRDDGTDHVIDIPIATVAGTFTVGGAQLPDAAFNYGRIWLVDPVTGDRALLGDTRDETFTADVVPGSYEIRYDVRESSGSAPINRDGLLGYVEVTKASEVIQDITIDVPVAHYSGDLLINGVAVASGLESADIDLHDLGTGATFRLGRTQDTQFDVALLPGTYEVVYKSVQGGVIAPVNTHHVLEVIDVEPGEEQHDIDVPTAAFSGMFTVEGQSPPQSSSDDGVLLLRSTDGQDSALLGNTHDVDFSRQIIPGDYEVFYAQETAGGLMPGNTNASLAPDGVVTVPKGGTADALIDVPVIELTGSLTIDGGEAPDSPYDDGRLYLRNAKTGDSVLLGNTRLGTYAARVVPGEYDIVYEAEFSDGVMPVNRGAVVEAGVALTATGQRNINIEVTSLTGDITVAGSPSDNAEGLGQLYLRDVVADDLVFLGHTGAPGFQQPLLGGRYVAEYHGVPSEGETLGLTLPANERATFACFDITAG